MRAEISHSDDDIILLVDNFVASSGAIALIRCHQNKFTRDSEPGIVGLSLGCEFRLASAVGAFYTEVVITCNKYAAREYGRLGALRRFELIFSFVTISYVGHGIQFGVMP